MSTPENNQHGTPQFSSLRFTPATTQIDECCCGTNSVPHEPISASPSDNRYSWKVSGMDCAACARKVENAVRQLNGVNHVQVLFATEKLVVTSADDIRAQVELAVSAAGYTLRGEDSPEEARLPRWKENLSLLILMVMMALSWGLEQINHPAGKLAFIATTLVGLLPVARQALRLMKNGSWFAIETLMSVAAIGALFIGATAEAAMVLLLFLIGERLRAGQPAGHARVSAP